MKLTARIPYYSLISQLTAREIKVRYKQSFLGYAWVLLNPFVQMVVMTFVFSLVLRIPSLGVPYPVFLYAALLPWLLFSTSLISSANSLVDNAPLLKKVYFPRNVFVISTMGAKLVDFCLASTVFVLLMIYFRMPVTVNVLWVVPILIIQEVFTYGLGLIFAAANLFYRDVQYLLGLVILLWMYLTPVIYPAEMLPEQYRWVFKLNPMAVLINAYREVILAGGAPKFSSLAMALMISLVTALAARAIFKKLEGSFADVA